MEGSFSAVQWLKERENLDIEQLNLAMKSLSVNKRKLVKSEHALQAKVRGASSSLGSDPTPIIEPVDEEDDPEVVKNKPVTEPTEVEISESMLQKMWGEIDSLDVSTVDKDSLRIFEYQGFSPDAILKSLMIAKTKNKISNSIFMDDILTFCALSIIKGSINEHNYKKISEEGKAEINRLESTYGVKRGSGRGEPPNIVTVSRIGAAFPGKVIQLLHENKVTARKFMGPFKTHTLPSIMRHQAFSAVIPSSLNEKTKEFLLSIITAFSVDQSVSINPNKKQKMDHGTLFDTQRSFIQITADNCYPPESVRLKLFKTFAINYEDLLTCARNIAKIVPEFVIVSRDDFNSDVNSIIS